MNAPQCITLLLLLQKAVHRAIATRPYIDFVVPIHTVIRVTVVVDCGHKEFIVTKHGVCVGDGVEFGTLIELTYHKAKAVLVKRGEELVCFGVEVEHIETQPRKVGQRGHHTHLETAHLRDGKATVTV